MKYNILNKKLCYGMLRLTNLQFRSKEFYPRGEMICAALSKIYEKPEPEPLE